MHSHLKYCGYFKLLRSIHFLYLLYTSFWSQGSAGGGQSGQSGEEAERLRIDTQEGKTNIKRTSPNITPKNNVLESLLLWDAHTYKGCNHTGTEIANNKYNMEMLIRAVLKIRREGGRGEKKGVWIYPTLKHILSIFSVHGFSHLDCLLIMEGLLKYLSIQRKIASSITGVG